MDNYSDEELLSETEKLRAKERMTLSAILDHLREIHRRRLYCDLGYGSLYKYLVKALGYSEGAAARRIKALKLTTKHPQAQKMIETGELNLSTAGVAQDFIEQGGSKKIISLLKNKTYDEAKQLTASADERPESSRYLDKDNIRVCWNLKKSTFEKFKMVQDRYNLPDIDAFLNKLLDDSLQRKVITRSSQGSSNPRTIPAKIKRELFERANHTCEFPGCDERRFLEIDHIVPVADGGTNEKENLQVLCKGHNQRRAILSFGAKHMERFI